MPKAEIAGNDYDLSINRYKEVEYEAVEHDSAAGDPGTAGEAGGGDRRGAEELEGMLG